MNDNQSNKTNKGLLRRWAEFVTNGKIRKAAKQARKDAASTQVKTVDYKAAYRKLPQQEKREIVRGDRTVWNGGLYKIQKLEPNKVVLRKEM